ncbi:MAG: LuxR C-terminal-related transcriptional regulator [Bacteroidota bacterium]
MEKINDIPPLSKKHDKVLASHNISFQMNILNGDLSMSTALASLIGIDNLEANYNVFMDLIPKAEFPSIHGIHQILLVFFNKHEDVKYKCRFNVIHTMLLKNGRRIRLLRAIYFLPSSTFNHRPICYNDCVDVTNIHFKQGVHFDIQLPVQLEGERIKMMRYFNNVLPVKPKPFSDRELEILKVWKDLDTTGKAANALGISERTLETHLRNMRRKLQVKRSMDVVLHARDQGWI